MGSTLQFDPIKLHKLLLSHIRPQELQTFCFDLEADYNTIVGPNDDLSTATRKVIAYFNSRGRLGELVEQAQHEFPNADWAGIVKVPRQEASDKTPVQTRLLGWSLLGVAVLLFASVLLATWLRGQTPVVAEPALPSAAATDLRATANATLGEAVGATTSAVSPTLASNPLPTSALALARVLTLTHPGVAPVVTMSFVLIPAGEFLMGGNAVREESPQHRVNLSDFYIGRYEVTNAQYAEFARDVNRAFSFPPDEDAYPVVNVSWEDALAFTNWLSKQTGVQAQLPTEAQWEKACRGTRGQDYPWGKDWDATKLSSVESRILSSAIETRSATTLVGKHSPDGDSPYGAADMAGNAWEWTADFYNSEIYEAHARSEPPVKDPQGPAGGEHHVLRGIAIDYNPGYSRCAARSGDLPVFTNIVGFRVVAESAPVP